MIAGRTANDRRRARRTRSAASWLAQPALDRAAHPGLDAADLLAADHPGQRFSDHGASVDRPWTYRARLMARPRKGRADGKATPHDMARRHDPLYALVRYRLERGD